MSKTTSVNLSQIDRNDLKWLEHKFNLGQSEALRTGLRMLIERYVNLNNNPQIETLIETAIKQNMNEVKEVINSTIESELNKRGL